MKTRGIRLCLSCVYRHKTKWEKDKEERMVNTKKGRGTRARRRTFFKSTWTRWVEAVTAGRAIRGFYYARDPRAPSNRGLWINIAISVGGEIERAEPSIDGAATERIDKNSSRTASRHKYSNKGRPCVVGPPWERFVSVPIFNARPRAGRLTSRGTREKFSRIFFLFFFLFVFLSFWRFSFVHDRRPETISRAFRIETTRRTALNFLEVKIFLFPMWYRNDRLFVGCLWREIRNEILSRSHRVCDFGEILVDKFAWFITFSDFHHGFSLLFQWHAF